MTPVRRIGVVAATATLIVLSAAVPASAAAASGEYAHWSIAGPGGAHTSTAAPAAAGFPAAGSPKIPNGTFTLVVPLQLALTGSAAAPAAGIGLLLVALGFLALHLGRRRAYR